MKNFVHTASLALCFSSVVASTSANLKNEIKHLKKVNQDTGVSAAYQAGKHEQAVRDQVATAHHKIKEKADKLREAVDEESPGVLSKIGNKIKKLGSTIKESTKSMVHKADNKRNEASAAYNAGKIAKAMENDTYPTTGLVHDEASIAYKAGKLEKNIDNKASHAYQKASKAIGKIDKKMEANAAKTKEKISRDLKALDKNINDTICTVKDGVNDEIAKIKSTINDKTAAIRNEKRDEIAKRANNATHNTKATSSYAHDKITCIEDAPFYHEALRARATATYSENVTRTLQALSSAEEKGTINSTELRQVVNNAPIEHAERNALLASITARPLKCAVTVTASLATTLYIAAVQKAQKSSNFDKVFKKTLNKTYSAVSKKSKHAPGIATISSGLMTIIVDLACQDGFLAAPYSRVPYTYLH